MSHSWLNIELTNLDSVAHEYTLFFEKALSLLFDLVEWIEAFFLVQLRVTVSLFEEEVLNWPPFGIWLYWCWQQWSSWWWWFYTDHQTTMMMTTTMMMMMRMMMILPMMVILTTKWHPVLPAHEATVSSQPASRSSSWMIIILIIMIIIVIIMIIVMIIVSIIMIIMIMNLYHVTITITIIISYHHNTGWHVQE